MRRYEFKVVPVPARCDAGSGAEGQDRVAVTLENALNALAVGGWEFHACETLSMRRGFWFSRKQMQRDVLIFRRERIKFDEGKPHVEEDIERAKARKSRPAAEAPSSKPRRIRPALPAAAA